MAVDDEPIALEKLENYIRRIPFLELVALCESPVEAVQIMMEQRVDALFVDINMPDLNGMEMVSSLRAAGRLLKQAKLFNDTATASDEDYLLVKDGYKYVNICIADILYIQGMRDYVKIYTEGKKSVIVNTSMTQIKEKLPACFLQVHRSWIVNIKKVKEIERMRIVIGEERIPVGDSYRQQFMEFLRLHSLDK